MNLLNQLKFRQQELFKEITALEKFLHLVPEGKIIAHKKANKFYYTKKVYLEKVLTTGANKTQFNEIYLPKDGKETLLLAKGEYAKRRLKDAQNELHAVDSYLKILEKEPDAEHFLNTHPGIKELILPSLKNPNEKLENWRTKEYYKNPYRPEGLIYPTVIPDLKVRSKSESDIIARLVHFNVPFHYEEGFNINGKWRFPDITCKAISNPYNEYYWEHLGGMSSFKYFESNMNKLKEFYSCGLIPWKNMIITTETDDEPLDINWVDEIIKYYLL